MPSLGKGLVEKRRLLSRKEVAARLKFKLAKEGEKCLGARLLNLMEILWKNEGRNAST